MKAAAAGDGAASSKEPEAHTADHHKVVADPAPSRLGRFQHPSAVAGLQVKASEAFAASIGCRNEADRRIVESDFRVAGRACPQREIKNLAPSGGKRRQSVGLDFSRDDRSYHVRSAGRDPVGPGG